jgi:hypothetical protein
VATIGCSAHLLRYDESVAPCRECFSTSSWLADGGHLPPHLGPTSWRWWWRHLVDYVSDVVPSDVARWWWWTSAALWSRTSAADATRLPLFEGKPASLRQNATPGWRCAQQRLLPILADVLRTAPVLPEFLLLIDDDTYVNAPRLGPCTHSPTASGVLFSRTALHGAALMALLCATGQRARAAPLPALPLARALPVRRRQASHLPLPIRRSGAPALSWLTARAAYRRTADTVHASPLRSVLSAL